ncbi:hypothetical protein BHE74_00054807 [Ensete ventricosum]|nr:hypothetical protein BHE74_00054807 [Ensete ventricosum]RZS14252.1 hypothetical protein BHM03_00045929 [Ensete ventricosum]
MCIAWYQYRIGTKIISVHWYGSEEVRSLHDGTKKMAIEPASPRCEDLQGYGDSIMLVVMSPYHVLKE